MQELVLRQESELAFFLVMALVLILTLLVLEKMSVQEIHQELLLLQELTFY